MAKSKTLVKILVANLAGKYGLSYTKGEEVKLEAKQAEELIEAGDAREWSAEIAKKEAAKAKANQEAAKANEPDRTSELKKLKRDELNEIATGLELKPEDFATIDDIIPAIVAAEEKSE